MVVISSEFFSPIAFFLNAWIKFSFLFSLASCGSGLSGEALTDAGHFWVGIDISQHMLGKQKVNYSLEKETS